jgi:hypothetical protein
MQNLNKLKIELMDTKNMTERLKSIVIPSCSYHDPTITLKFPYLKSDSETKFISITNHKGTDIEIWADEVGYLYEVNLLIYKEIAFINDIVISNIEIGIPCFNYGQIEFASKSINFECKNLKISTTSKDLVIQFCRCSLQEIRWIGYDKMYYGVNVNNILTSIIYKDYGCKDLVIKA